MIKGYGSGMERLEILADFARSVALTGARQGLMFREILYHSRVGSELEFLDHADHECCRAFCGFLHTAGWQVLSKTLALVTGEDKSLAHLDQTQPIPLHASTNREGGWVRIFRLKAAALPRTRPVVDAKVRSVLQKAFINEESRNEIRGLYGIPPFAQMTSGLIREAVLASDIFEAPWMVAVWHPEGMWVVNGSASRYVDGESNHEDPGSHDLFTRKHADQTFAYDKDGTMLPRTGPSIGLEVVIDAVDQAIRCGHHLDVILDPFESPIEAWDDGIHGVGDSPLMGFRVGSESRSWFITLLAAPGGEWAIASLPLEDYVAFHSVTGIDPQQTLGTEALVALTEQGTPVFGQIPTFLIQ